MIHVTKAASDKLKSIREEGRALRVSVVGGGCSGLSYKMAWVDPASINDKDKLFVVDTDLKVVVDGRSYLFIEGSMLDFTEGLEGKGFEWNNPGKTHCGCGTSFR